MTRRRLRRGAADAMASWERGCTSGACSRGSGDHGRIGEGDLDQYFGENFLKHGDYIFQGLRGGSMNEPIDTEVGS